MKNKYLLLFIILILSLSACKKDEESNPVSIPNTNYYADFTVDSLSVYTYETIALPINTNASSSEIIYAISNDSIAKIEGDKVIPLKGGSTTITAKVGNSELDSIIINVVDDQNVPFLEVSNNELNLIEGSVFDTEAKVLLRTKEVSANIQYISSDESIATVDENGSVTALKPGVAYINVFATYNRYTSDTLKSLARTIVVNVNPLVVLDIASESNIINTRNEVINNVQYSNEVDLFGTLLTATEQKSIFETNCQWISTNSNVAKVENNKIVGYAIGTTDIYAQLTIDNVVYTSNYLSITVENPTILVSERQIDVDLSNNELVLPNDFMLNGDTNILKIFDKENPLINIYENKKLISYDKLGPRKWIIQSTNNNYEVDVVVCSKIITTKEELASLHTYGQNVVKGLSGIVSYEGYFILGSNIDMKGTRFRTFCGINTGATSYTHNGFIGVFDGRGYTITNASVTAENSGLFPTLNKKSIVKNVAFVDATVSGDSGLITSNFGGRIENVYIEGKLTCNRATADNPNSLLASKIYDGSKIVNCIVYLKNPSTNYNYSSAIGMLVTAKEDALENVYVLGTNTKVLSTSAGDRYALLANEGNGQFINYSDLLLVDLSSFNNHWVFGDTNISFTNLIGE